MKLTVFFYLLIVPLFTCCQNSGESRGLSANFSKQTASADSAIRAGEFGELHSLVIMKYGKLIFEKYYNNWKPDSVHQLQSATKSVVATLLGCAVQNGFIKSVDEKIINYFPAGFITDPLMKTIRIKDLLTQEHGLKWKEAPWNDPDNTWRKILATQGNWYKDILQTPMDTLPGTKFNYSNAAPVLVTAIIQHATKMNIDDFARQFLFAPLGITNYNFWQGNGGPQNNGMALLYLTSKDMAKIGQLYLQKGNWSGKQIISEQFVQQSTSAIVKNVGMNGFYKSYDYGYFWWSNPVLQGAGKATAVFIARGAGGQNIIVWPAKEMVIVITAWNMQQPNKPQAVFERYLLAD